MKKMVRVCPTNWSKGKDAMTNHLMVSLITYQSTDKHHIIFNKLAKRAFLFDTFYFVLFILEDYLISNLSPFNAFPKGDAKDITKASLSLSLSFTLPIPSAIR